MKPNKNQPWCDGRDVHNDTEDGCVEHYTEHPRVYLAWDEEGKAHCSYCGKKFVQKQEKSK